MLRWRFSSGLILGLILGIPTGALLASALLPNPPADTRLQFEVRELTRRLEMANEARARAEKQMEEFSKLADQMTKSFENLERRFQELEAELASVKPPSAAPRPPATPPAETPAPLPNERPPDALP
ncbi:MAG: hypothetical protein KatS3mg077_0889 [Candidatus Binatia bacterium]|nr:MAG: hypothetical protein KatS3mg077_0889 [Candidatus Binatia bacterium]